jgi:hypothetical protein
MKKFIFVVCLFLLGPSIVFAQFRDTLSHPDSVHKRITSEDSAFPYHAKPNIRDIGLQFLSGEVAYNATMFGLFGSTLFYGPLDQVEFQPALGILASFFTVPLAIYLTSDLLNLKSGSLAFAIAGAVIGFLPLGISLWAPANTYLTRYLSLSLPPVTLAMLFYDFSLWTDLIPQ